MTKQELDLAELDTRHERLAHAIAKMVERNRNKIYRRKLEGGCVLLQPGNYWGRRSKCTVVLTAEAGDGVFARGISCAAWD